MIKKKKKIRGRELAGKDIRKLLSLYPTGSLRWGCGSVSCIRLPQVESPAPEMGCALGSVADHRRRENANHRTGRHTDRKRPNERHRKNNLRTKSQRVVECLEAAC